MAGVRANYAFKRTAELALRSKQTIAPQPLNEALGVTASVSAVGSVMNCLEVYATLRIISSSLHPDEINRIIGINATKAQPTEPNSKYRPTREHHYWGWESRSEVQSLDGLVHVRAVIDLLRGKEEQLNELRAAGCEIDVCCFWVSSGQGGPSLDVAALESLANLRLEIWWDVYFGEEEEYRERVAGDIAGVA